MFRYIFLAVVLFCVTVDAAPQPKALKRDASEEFLTSEEWEDMSDMEKLLLLLVIQSMIESGELDGAVVSEKARSISKRDASEEFEFSDEEWEEFEMFLTLLILQSMFENGDFDEDFFSKKARSAMKKRDASEEMFEDFDEEDWEAFEQMLLFIILASMFEDGDFEDDFATRKARSALQKREESEEYELTDEEMEEFEQLIMFLILMSMMESGDFDFDEDMFSKKARSAMQKRDASEEVFEDFTDEDWAEFEQLLVFLIIQSMLEGGDFDDSNFLRRARSTLKA
jgi:hypothetical protein